LDEHTPVLVEEAIAALAIRPAGLYIDATFGRGGHSARILQALGPDGRLIALDRDPAAIAAGRMRFAHEPRLCLLHAAFADLAVSVHPHLSRPYCDGILFDLGVSSPQLGAAERGFSFERDGPLDMRLDPTRGRPVSAWLAEASRDEIRHVIGALGEERFAGRIATSIVRARAVQPLTRTTELAALVARSVPTRESGKHPATRTFQALRMHVNEELSQLQAALEQTVALLQSGGRLAVIAFHSLEDRIVKQFIRSHSQVDARLAVLPLSETQVRAAARLTLRAVGRKQRPSAQEIAANPRARSALLRVAERLPRGES
jgi:16S rRNA (cytosine1402-N4)-methyltransferase